MAFEVEQLFKAVDILVERRLEDVNFDRTIICTITDDSDKKNGCYVVSDGTIKFKAYTNDTSYKTDDQVRVSVLNGDFSEKKFISGRYTGDEESNPITYKSPLESIIPITGNLITNTRYSNSDGVNSLRANSATTSLDIWSIDLSSNQAFRDLQSNGIYNTLTIKADFKTLMSHHDLIAGNYGLRLDLFIQPSLNSKQRIRKYITLDSSEMMGNPYSFSVYSTQAKKVDIVSTGIIAEMVLWIYQSVNGDGNKSRFINREGDEITPGPFDDILIKNIEVGFGSDIEKVSDNTLELFTPSSPYYVYDKASTETNRKELEVLWYNKTENNEYVGYSDGLFDLKYDEIDYLKKSNLNSRLMSQVGRTDVPSDEPGLKLAADLKDAKPIMIKARDALTNEVADVLYNLQRQVQSANTIYNKLDDLLDTVKGSLVTQWTAANTALENWNSAYIGVLQYAYNKENKITPNEWNTKWDTDYYNKFKSAIELGVKSVRDFFVWFDKQTGPTALQSGHRGNYDLYFYRIEKELEIIEDWIDELNALLKDNYTKLTAYENSSYKFTPYEQTDFSAYANKYCLYWYRYEPGYKLEYKKDANNDEYNFGKFMSDGWHRMEDMADTEWHAIKKLPQNYGLPTDKKSGKDGKTYYVAKALGQTVKRDMVREMVEEKYAVILFYNHEMYKSNIITFTNSEPDKIPKEELLDRKDVLQIEHDVDSLEHYQVYNEFNQLRSLDDGGRIRQLKCFYKGLYKQDEALINAGVYWYIPNHNTMLTIDTDYLQEEGFNTDAGGRTEHSIDGYTYYYKKINSAEITNNDGNKVTTSNEADRIFYYKIKPMLEKDATNNTILVKAYLEGIEDPVEGEITMTFSTFGSNGTKYTLSVVPSGSQVSVMEGKPLRLKVGLRDYNNQPIKIVDASQVKDSNNAYGFSVSNWERSPNAFDISVIYDETNTYVEGLTVSLNKNGNAKNWDTTRPYFGIINAKVTYFIANEAEDSEEEKVTYYDKSKTVTLNTLVPLTYASGNYYMSGATTIVYNNQGIVSYMSEDEYLLYQVNQKGQTPIKNQVWSIEYYDNTGKYISPGTSTYQMLRNYMPVLKQGENRLVPAPLYIEDLNYIPVVICTVNGDFAWAQPIIITQNRYASSTLDSWNGSLIIGEKNGTILSTAVGAGKKEADNSFSGILMGDIGKGLYFDTDNMSGLGLYGFNWGAQSFCLSVDGTAFFGKAGRGRILINGDHGTIASASYETVRKNGGDPSGMMIDLDDGYIHILGVKKQGLDYFPDKNATTLAQAEILISTTGIWDGIDDAYFKIRSKDQTNLDHYLMYIGKKDYYLQTDNFKPVEYNPSDSTGNIPTGEGLKLDLAKGRLDAYDFQLRTKNVFIDSSENSTAFFIIKDNYGINLFYAGKNGTKEVFYLKSSDFSDAIHAGTKINLTDGSITSYNFTLKAGNTSGNNPTIELVSGGVPYLRIRNDNDKVLLSIQKKTTDPSSGAIRTPEEFYLQSGNYKYGSSGTQLDLVNNTFNAYSGFTLQAYKSGTSQYVLLDATASDYPLKVYGSSTKYFQVNWNGGLEATGATITGAINATSGTFSGDITVTGTLKGGTISGATILGGTLDIGGTGAVGGGVFTVNSSGHMKCTSATIGGWTVTQSSFSGNGMTFSGGAGGGINSPYWNVGANGKTTITELTVSTSLTTSNTCQVYIDGNVGIGKDPETGYDLVLGGKMKIAGRVYFGETAYLYTNGALFYIKEASWIYLDAQHVQVGNSGAGIGIGGNPATDAGVTIIYGKVQINSPDDLTLKNADGKTVVSLADYIKNIGEFDTNTVTANAYFLVSNDGKKTKYDVGSTSKPVYFKGGIPVECTSIYAPTTKGTSGQVWQSNGVNGTPGWATISTSVSWSEVTGKPTSKGGSTTPVYIDSNGNFQSCTTYSSASVSYATNAGGVLVSGSSRGYVATVPAGSGQYRYIGVGPSVNTLSTESSRRFKKNINDLNNSQILYNLQPISYQYKEEKGYDDNIRYGFIAEDVNTIAPELVEKNPDSGLCDAIYYNSILTLAVAEIQKLRKELDELKSNFNI